MKHKFTDYNHEKVYWAYMHLLRPHYKRIGGESIGDRIDKMNYISFETRDFILPMALKCGGMR